ncbi:hypothetical protein T484DRAFT_1979675 [Baffinella frigidus]|nr:hypothetical protein T484DRAFT_1979675 [Cryptophyta sp. CCMP2293]
MQRHRDSTYHADFGDVGASEDDEPVFEELSVILKRISGAANANLQSGSDKGPGPPAAKKSHCVIRDSSKNLLAHQEWKAGGEDADRQDVEDRSAAKALRQSPYNRRNSNFNIKHYARPTHSPLLTNSFPNKKPMLEFQVHTVLAPDLDWLNDTEDFEEPAPARVEAPEAKRRVYRTTPYVKPCASGRPQTSSGQASSEQRCAESCALLLTPQGRHAAKALVEQLHCKSDRRKTPMPKRAPPREPETIQRILRRCAQLPQEARVRPFEQKAEQHGGRTWEEYTATITRSFQSVPRVKTCVWRLGDDACV